MPAKVLCPNPACRKASAGSADLAGHTVRCKHCGQLFVVPLPAATQSPNETNDPPGAPPTADDAPATIGRFVVRGRLGAGAFGTVYRAHDPQLDREVAVKVPTAGALDGPRRVERFLREARAAANLRHPHVVPVFEAGRDGGRYYIAAAFIDGTTLADAVEEGGMEIRRAARLARELAEALAYAHGQGIVHRDVKPANCMLDRQDRLHLMDFGLAARADDEARLTTDGAVLGTPSYMAPEQAAGQRGEAHPAADQYALGVVLYELLTGEVPFHGPPATVIHHAIHTQPPSPRTHRPSLPRDLETICLKALAKSPADRYPDCGAMADDLRRWLEGEPIAARRQSTWERTRRWAGKNKAIAALSLAVLAALAMGTVVSVGFALSARSAATQADDRKREAEDALAAAETAAANEAAERIRAEDAGTVARIAGEKAEADRRIADVERKNAVEAGKKLEEEREKAVKAAKDAITERERASVALKNLLEAQVALEQSGRVARDNGYVAYLSLANLQLQTKETTVAARTLDKCPPQHRGWEWRYLTDWAQQVRPAMKESGLVSGITAAAFTPDGERIVIGQDTGMVSCYRVSTSERMWTGQGVLPSKLVLRALAVRDIAVSPDGKFAVCLGKTNRWDQGLQYWNLETGKMIRELVPPLVSLGKLVGVAISADGRMAAAAAFEEAKGAELTGCVWDLESGEVLDKHPFAGAPVHLPRMLKPEGVLQFDRWICAPAGGAAVAFHPTEAAVAYTRGGSTDVMVWSENKAMVSLTGHAGPVRRIVFHPTEARIFTAGADGMVKIWDSASGMELLNLPGPGGGVVGLHLAPDGSLSAAYDSGRAIRWSPPVKPPFTLVDGKFGSVRSLAWNAASDRLLIGGAKQTEICRWPANKIERLIESPTPHAAWSADGKQVVARSDASTLTVLDLDSGSRRFLRSMDGELHSFEIRSDANRVVGLRRPKEGLPEVVTWQLPPLVPGENVPDVIEGVKGKAYRGTAASLSPNGRLLLHTAPGQTGGYACDPLSDAKPIYFPSLHEQGKSNPLTVLAASPDGRFVGMGMTSGIGGIVDARTGGRPLQVLRGHRGPIVAIAFSNDGKMVFTSGQDDGTVRIWEIASGKSVKTLSGQKGVVSTLAASPDGRWLATGSAEECRVWDLKAVMAVRK